MFTIRKTLNELLGKEIYLISSSYFIKYSKLFITDQRVTDNGISLEQHETFPTMPGFYLVRQLKISGSGGIT